MSGPSLSWFQWWALCYHLSFSHRVETKRREDFMDTMLRSVTRIFRPEVYEKMFPPTEMEQLMKLAREDEGEEITPDDFGSIDQFIKGLGDLKSSALPDDEGWV